MPTVSTPPAVEPSAPLAHTCAAPLTDVATLLAAIVPGGAAWIVMRTAHDDPTAPAAWQVVARHGEAAPPLGLCHHAATLAAAGLDPTEASLTAGAGSTSGAGDPGGLGFFASEPLPADPRAGGYAGPAGMVCVAGHGTRPSAASVPALRLALAAATRQVAAHLTAAAHAREHQLSQHRRDEFLTANPAAVFKLRVVDSRLVPEWHSRRVAELLGCPPDEPDHWDWWHERLHPEARAALLARPATLPPRDQLEHEYRLRRADGTYRWVHSVLQVARDRAGQPERVLGVWFDLTERRSAEEALRRSEQRFRSYFDLPLVGMALTGPDLRWIAVNDRYCAIVGRTREQLQGCTWIDLTHPDDVAADLALQERMTGGGVDAYSIEKRYVRPDGSWVVASVSQRCLRAPDGAIECYCAVVQDVTARHEAETRVREQAALLEHTHDAILVVDAQRRLHYANHRATQFYGPLAARLGTALDDLLFAEASGAGAAAAEAALQFGRWAGPARTPHATGRRLLDHRWTHVRQVFGLEDALLIVARDITEQKELEDRVLRSQRLESIGLLAGGIAHDLNNVFAPLSMALGLLRHAGSTPDDGPLLDLLGASIERGTTIVRQLLTLGRGLEAQRTEIAVGPLLHDLANLIGRTFPKSITVQREVPADLWSILADPSQLQQVLLNLSVNARDAMPDGGRLTLAARNFLLDETGSAAIPDAAPGPYVQLTVADTGSGMSSEVLARAFEPYFSTKPTGTGTGLGLPTAQAIVRGHGGFITLDSQLGRGTRLQLYLPSAAVPSPTDLRASSEPLRRGQGELILVVDDEAMIRVVAERLLVAHGYQVITADDGAEALIAYVRELNRVRAVLTDIAMPTMDGSSLVRALRRVSATLPIIAMSGRPQLPVETLPTGDRYDAFLQKPFSSAELLRLLARCLDAPVAPAVVW